MMSPMMKLLAVVALILPLAQEKNEAEELFKKMEAKVSKAKTLRAVMTGEMAEAKMKLSGEILLDEGSKVRLEVEGKTDSMTRKGTVVSDGKRMHLKSSGGGAGDPPDPAPFDAPSTFGTLIRVSLARAGLLSALEFCDTEEKAKTDPETGFKVSGLKLGPKEKVGDREAQAVTYTVTRKGRDAAATLWIDIATHLPLKRALKVDGMELTENYSDVKLDEKIDAAKFEVPKETK